MSLNRPLGQAEGASEFGNLLADEDATNAEEDLVHGENRRLLGEAIEALPERPRYVLVRRHGLDYHKKATLKQLGEELGVSCERVRQLQEQAERTLARTLRGALRGEDVA